MHVTTTSEPVLGNAITDFYLVSPSLEKAGLTCVADCMDQHANPVTIDVGEEKPEHLVVPSALYLVI